MLTQKSFGHDIEALALARKQLRTHLQVAANSLKQAYDLIDYLNGITDKIHAEINPMLPKEGDEV